MQTYTYRDGHFARVSIISNCSETALVRKKKKKKKRRRREGKVAKEEGRDPNLAVTAEGAWEARSRESL